MNITKWTAAALMTMAIVSMAIVATGCKKSDHQNSGEQAHQYTCPHHPEVVQDKPGTCPKCNMKLVEKK